MIKTILYTSNPDVQVESLSDVEDFAAAAGKYYTCIAKEGSNLYSLKEGAHILTSKGNNVYVLEVTEGAEEYDGAKKSSITGIVSIDYPFGEPSEDLFEGMKETFAFHKVEDVKLSINGQICVRTTKGYVTITDNNELVRYPKSMVIDVPMYVMPKSKNEVVAGDIIVADGDYVKVTKNAEGKLITISYKGSGRTVYAVKDYLLNDSFVKVVISPMSGAFQSNGTINPMMLMAMSEDSDNLLPLIMMQNSQQMNPAMLLLMDKKKKNNDMLQTMLMMQTMSGQNPFANIVKPTNIENN